MFLGSPPHLFFWMHMPYMGVCSDILWKAWCNCHVCNTCNLCVHNSFLVMEQNVYPLTTLKVHKMLGATECRCMINVMCVTTPQTATSPPYACVIFTSSVVLTVTLSPCWCGRFKQALTQAEVNVKPKFSLFSGLSAKKIPWDESCHVIKVADSILILLSLSLSLSHWDKQVSGLWGDLWQQERVMF